MKLGRTSNVLLITAAAILFCAALVCNSASVFAAASNKPYKAYLAPACSGATKIDMHNNTSTLVGFEPVISGKQPTTTMVRERKTLIVNAAPGTQIYVNGPADGGKISKVVTTPPKCSSVKADFQVDPTSRQATVELINFLGTPMKVDVDLIIDGNVFPLARFKLQAGEHRVEDFGNRQLPKGAFLRSSSGINLDFVKVGR